ncbi:MAG: nucleotidyltransferase family protein [Elusimicrobiota bacterium]
MNREDIGRELLIDWQVRELLGEFAKDAIESIVLKGAALRETVYAPGLRPIDDLDLLIQKKDLPDIERVLARLNYQVLPCGELNFIRPGCPVAIDLHTEIWYLSKKNLEQLWSRALLFEIDGVEARSLGPQDNLIFIVAHAAIHHGWLEDKWLMDCALIIKKYNLDWEELYRQAKLYNLAFSLREVLTRVQKIEVGFSDELCEKITTSIERLSWVKIPGWQKKILSRVWRSAPVGDIGHLLRPMIIPGFFFKLNFLIKFLFPAPVFVLRRYQSSCLMLPFLYLYRPISLVFKGFKILFQCFLSPRPLGPLIP